MRLLKNKIAVITGGGRGIGKAIASQYSEQGATVVIAEFDENSGKNTAEKIGGHFFKADISDENGVSTLFDYVKTNFSCLDILVNNAGILTPTSLEDIDEETWDSHFEVNTKGVLLMCQSVLPHMREKKFGRIINIASIAGLSLIHI